MLVRSGGPTVDTARGVAVGGSFFGFWCVLLLVVVVVVVMVVVVVVIYEGRLFSLPYGACEEMRWCWWW